MQVIWNNLIKLGKANAAGKPCSVVLEWEDNWFDVVSFELDQLKPDIVIFFSGPYYDEHINRILHGSSFHPVNERPTRQLARVDAPGLRARAMRTYHPNYQYRAGFREYLGDIVNAIDL